MRGLHQYVPVQPLLCCTPENEVTVSVNLTARIILMICARQFHSGWTQEVALSSTDGTHQGQEGSMEQTACLTFSLISCRK